MKAEALVTQLAKNLANSLKVPLLSFNVNFGRDAMRDIVLLTFSLNVLSKKVNRNECKKIIVNQISETFNRGSFRDENYSIENTPAEGKFLYQINSCVMEVDRKWDAVQRVEEVKYKYIIEMQDRINCVNDSLKYHRDSCGQIIKEIFFYKAPKIDTVSLSPLATSQKIESKEIKLSTISGSFFASNNIQPKIWKRHPDANTTRFVLFKSERANKALELKQALVSNGLHAYVRETPKGKSSVLVNLSK